MAYKNAYILTQFFCTFIYAWFILTIVTSAKMLLQETFNSTNYTVLKHVYFLQLIIFNNYNIFGPHRHNHLHVFVRYQKKTKWTNSI